MKCRVLVALVVATVVTAVPVAGAQAHHPPFTAAHGKAAIRKYAAILANRTGANSYVVARCSRLTRSIENCEVQWNYDDQGFFCDAQVDASYYAGSVLKARMVTSPSCSSQNIQP